MHFESITLATRSQRLASHAHTDASGQPLRCERSRIRSDQSLQWNVLNTHPHTHTHTHTHLDPISRRWWPKFGAPPVTELRPPVVQHTRTDAIRSVASVRTPDIPPPGPPSLPLTGAGAARPRGGRRRQKREGVRTEATDWMVSVRVCCTTGGRSSVHHRWPNYFRKSRLPSLRRRGDLSPCRQNPMDFDLIASATRTQSGPWRA